MSIVSEQFHKLFGACGPIINPDDSPIRNSFESKHNTTFFLDLTTLKYGHMNQNCRELTGYSSNYLLEGGVESYLDLWHDQCASSYLHKILPTMTKCLLAVEPDEASRYIFGRTYFLHSKKGETRKIFERDIFLFHPSQATPVAVTGWATDITHISDMDRNTFFVEDTGKTGAESILYKETIFVNNDTRVLTLKELEVLRWIANGLSSKQIADRMHLSIHTVHNHRKNMLEKTNSTNAVELINYAYKHCLI